MKRDPRNAVLFLPFVDQISPNLIPCAGEIAVCNAFSVRRYAFFHSGDFRDQVAKLSIVDTYTFLNFNQ